MPSGRPFASIVLPAYCSHATIRASVESILHQTFDDFELIVVDSSPDDRSEAIVRDAFPRVLHHRYAERLLPHQARNLGAQKASGQILVFTDPDCVAAPDWLERLAAHHRNGRPVVGGAITSLPGWWNSGVQATKYPWWYPESAAGPRSEIPSGNCSFSRDVWEKVQGFRGEYFAGDSEICWRIRAAGHEIWFEPRAVVTHLDHPTIVPFIAERVRRGRDFGRMRVRTQHWSRARCLAYLLAAPALPWIMMGRAATYALTGGSWLRWLPTLPIQVLGNGLWCLGEASAHGKALFSSSPLSRR